MLELMTDFEEKLTMGDPDKYIIVFYKLNNARTEYIIAYEKFYYSYFAADIISYADDYAKEHPEVEFYEVYNQLC